MIDQALRLQRSRRFDRSAGGRRRSAVSGDERRGNGVGDVPGGAPRHLPPAGRRLPALRMRRGVLDRPLADHTGIHSRDHLRGVRAGGLSEDLAEQAAVLGEDAVQRVVVLCDLFVIRRVSRVCGSGLHMALWSAEWMVSVCVPGKSV